MTRQHFRRIAETLRAMRPKFKSHRAFMQFCTQMGYTCAEFNSKFDMGKFIDACHNEDEKHTEPKDLI